MAEAKVCVCPQCGKKYQLKEGFAAESFACKACSATVWVAGKPAAPSPKRPARRAGGRAPAGRGKGRAAAAPRGRARGRREAEAEEPQEEGRGRRGYQKKKDNTPKVIAAVGGVAVIGIVLFLVLGGKKKEEAQGTTETAQTPGVSAPGQAPEEPAGTATPAKPGPKAEGAPEAPAGETPAAPEEDEETPAPPPAKKLDGTAKTPSGALKSRFDPPTDLPHVEGTPPDVQKQIDDLVAVMFDPDAGRDSLDAKKKLVALGKPAFPRILGKMASVRDTITDVDSMEERLLESSLKLADEALREMDGYLESNQKSVLRPGSEKKYIAYICRLHYKRWVQVLEAMPEMPGPFDSSKAYEKESEEYGG